MQNDGHDISLDHLRRSPAKTVAAPAHSSGETLPSSTGSAAECESQYKAELQAYYTHGDPEFLIAAHEAFTRWMNAVIAAKPQN